MIRVLIAEDHVLDRRGIRAMLATAKDIEIVAEARDGIEAVAMTEHLAPDLVLLDLSMPGQDGFQALEQIRALHRGTRIVVLSKSVNEELVRRAMQKGVYGYLVKGCSRIELLAAIRAAHQSRMFLSSAALDHLPKLS